VNATLPAMLPGVAAAAVACSASGAASRPSSGALGAFALSQAAKVPSAAQNRLRR